MPSAGASAVLNPELIGQFACHRHADRAARHNPTNGEECVMNTNLKIALAVIVGAALGVAATQGLHAQAKPKAYTVTEIEVLDLAAVTAYGPVVQAVIKNAGGKNLNTAGGQTVSFVGVAPKRVAINEFDNLEQAQAFINSAVYKNIIPQRDKAEKVLRQYAVEAVN
jgi:uncharacterized protein (DUF1330 family)